MGESGLELRGLKLVNESDTIKSQTELQLTQLPSLPSTEEEINAVGSLFDSTFSKSFQQEKATEQQLKSLDLSSFNVILFATHGIIAGEWEYIDEPGLVLTPTIEPEITDNDGLLTASEIRELELNAEIVVLSACNTAAGDIDSDEGLSGLASAFIFAGAKSIVASHWSVDDESTQLLVSNFFKNLKQVKSMKSSGQCVYL